MIMKSWISMAFRVVIVATLSLAAGVRPGIAAADLSSTVEFNIGPQPLPAAILKYSEQSGVQVASPSLLLDGRPSHGVSGTLPVREALQQLLGGTGLGFAVIDANTVIIRQSTPLTQAVSSAGATSTEERVSQGEASSSPGSPSDNNGVNAAATAPPQSEEGKREALTEVVVTAQKREERLQDVPVPITVIDASTLVENNLFRIDDYFSTVPGLSVATTGNGFEQLAIRGITTGGNTNPTVGVVIDDVAVNGSSALTDNASYIPDIDPSDLARVEVLRGPQGTLYGANSLGGLIKYVTADPSPESISGRIQANVNHIENGDGEGYGGRGYINVPITDTLAIRASGYWRKDAGYVDDASLGASGVNQTDAFGGRFSALWKPSEFFSVKVNALTQETLSHGTSDTEPALGVLQQVMIRNTGGWESQIHFYDATIKASFAGIDLTSVTGYAANADSQLVDYSQFGIANNLLFSNVSETQKVTQELRLNASVGKYFDWLVGAFFTHEHSPTNQVLYSENLGTGAPIPDSGLVDFNFPIAVSEYAGFADVTAHITDRLDLQVGGRESVIRQVFRETDTGPGTELFDGLPSPVIYPSLTTRANTGTYLVSPSFKFSSDLMVYARIATGYRPGGPNPAPELLHAPSTFLADSTTNYEIGAKGSLFDHLLTFDNSVYYIDWKDIQIDVYTPEGQAYFTNAGGAKSEGVELAQTITPMRGFSISAWEVWDEAIITHALPQGGPPAGEELPYSSRWSANLSINQEFPMGRMTAYIKPWVSYVGPRWSSFTSTDSDRILLPSYTSLNAIAGVRVDKWNVDLLIKNISDQRGVMNSGNYGSLRLLDYIQPRTVGITFTYAF